MALKTTTKVAIGIFVGLGVYLIYKMFMSYGQNSAGLAPGETSGGMFGTNSSSDLAVSSSNLSQPTTDKTQLATSNNVSPAVYVPPSTGPTTETRFGRGLF